MHKLYHIGLDMSLMQLKINGAPTIKTLDTTVLFYVLAAKKSYEN